MDLADAAFAKVRRLNAPLGWVLLYLAAGLIALRLQPAGGPVFWYPPIAIAIAFLHRCGLRFWPAVLAAELVVSAYQFGASPGALAIPVAITLGSVCAAVGLGARRPGFEIASYRDLAWLILCCAGAILVGATVGTILLTILNGGAAQGGTMWLTWWSGDAASAISLLPSLLILTAPSAPFVRASTGRWEGMAMIGVAVALALLTFGRLPFGPRAVQEALEPLIFVPVLWAGLRASVRRTSAVILATALSVVLFHQWGDIAALEESASHYQLLKIQCFAAALSVVGLAIALALDRERQSRIDAESQAEQLRDADAELRTASTRLMLAAKAANVGVWDWNLEDNSLIWDAQVYAMYRIDPNSPDKYAAWLERVHPEDRARLLAELDGMIARGEEVRSNFRVVLPDGDVRHFNTHGIIQPSKDGKARHIIGIDYDVTELVRQRLKAEASEHQAAAANRAKSEFLAIMSHELRTPLNAIIGFSDLMVREAFGPMQSSRYADYVKDIHSSGQLLLALINDILDLARIEAGKRDFNFEPIGSGEMLSAVARQLAPLAEAKGLRLSVKDTESWPVMADARALRQLLNNLVANAIKFTDAGAVTLSAEPVSGKAGAKQVTMRVTDTGRGIPRERIQDLCKPFVQIADSLRRDVGGIGLGLAISRSLAEAMGGKLEIDSELGQGTTVRVSLPAA